LTPNSEGKSGSRKPFKEICSKGYVGQDLSIGIQIEEMVLFFVDKLKC
jgi:hypothetical protein